MMTVILANNLLTMQFPQPSVMIRASSDEVCRVGAKGAVPDPALMAGQGSLQWERVRIAVVVQLGGFLDVDLPDLGRVVR